MGYHHLLIASLPAQAPPRLSLRTRSPRGHVTAATSPTAARSPLLLSASASAATRRRAVLLVGVSVLPLLRLRDAAAVAAAAHPSTVELVTDDDKMDFQKTKGPQLEEPLAEPPQPEEKGPSPGNPLASLLNAIAVIASGVLAGLFGTSRREKKALQSFISYMETKLAENEAKMSFLRENFEKLLLEEAEQKKQASMFEDQESSLLDQLASTKRTVTSLNMEVLNEKELVKQLKHKLHQLESSTAQADTDRHAFESKLREKLQTLDILQDKVNMLSHDVKDKEVYIRDLTSSMTSTEGDYQNLQLIYNQTKDSLEYANSKIEQLEKDVLAAKHDLNSKISSIDSLNEKVETLYTAKTEAEEKLSDLMKQYVDMKTDSETRASNDAELLFKKDGQLSHLEEKHSCALSDSANNRAVISELNSELETTRTLLNNEVETRKSLSALVQSTEEAHKESQNELFKLSEKLDEANISNQDLATQISKFTDETNEVKQTMDNKIAEVESVSRTLSDEVVSVKEILQKRQEDLEVTSNQLVHITEAHDELKKELLDAYKRLESTTNDLVSERKINATLSRELGALVKQSLVESEARRTLQADLDEATISLNEVNESTIFLTNKLQDTNSMVSTIKEEKEILSKALVDQKKSTAGVQKNMVDSQNLIKRLGAERENFEVRSKKLEEELSTAKGEILSLRRHISASGSHNTDAFVDTSETTNISQPMKEKNMNGHVPITSSTDAGAPPSAKKIYRKRTGRPAT